MKRQHGITLIELLIAAAIVGILGAIALPAYRDYVIRGKLSDAQSMLGGTRTLLEQYYQDNRSYPPQCGGTSAGLPAFTLPTSQYFTYTCGAGATAGQTFVLTATGKSDGGTGGFTYTIDDQGTRATTAVPSGWSTQSNCWVVRKPGSC
ncbi:MAG: prepilin-type N-terminal cleavage/methylation domain-containing protein [Betaproteobacteria bacterium]|nr:prepilin-type N-terminal cleavage/methylation domain-containing protein [Betaproteobacteria bacterium]